MCLAPRLLAWIIPPEAQQECGDLLAVTRVVYVRGLASAHEVTHGFVPLVWNPHGDQLSSPEQLGQVERVATVGLDAVTRFAGNERRGHDTAIVAKLLDRWGPPHNKKLISCISIRVSE